MQPDNEATFGTGPVDQDNDSAPLSGAIDEMPLPSDPKTIFLGGLFILAAIAAAYVASEIIVPLIFAIILRLMLLPAMRFLTDLRAPRTFAALVLIVALFATITGLGAAISGPARTWAAKLPEGIPRLQERLSVMRAPVAMVQRFQQQLEDFGDVTPSKPLPKNAPRAVPGASLLTQLLTGTRNFASAFFTTVLLLYFLLASGDTFLHRLVEILPRFAAKRQAVDITNQIQSDISAYLVIITLMNAALGVTMALVTWMAGLGDPILWGAVAFFLNYVPILGPTLAFSIFLLAGLLTVEPLWQALLPAAIYLGLHVIEGETLTPTLLARRFTLNPVLVMFSLVFWYWMWGIPGAILAMPMLAIAKIICDRVRPLVAFGHFLER
jgi:predicted PurR-regulated permease PerM